MTNADVFWNYTKRSTLYQALKLIQPFSEGLKMGISHLNGLCHQNHYEIKKFLMESYLYGNGQKVSLKPNDNQMIGLSSA